MKPSTIRQVDYLDTLEASLLRAVAVCSVHGVILELPDRTCSACNQKSMRRKEQPSR